MEANATNMGANATNVGANVTNMEANVTNMTANATNVGANVTNVGANVTNVGANVTNMGAKKEKKNSRKRATSLEKAVKYVFTLLPSKEDLSEVQLRTVSTFPLPAIRESVANSVIHQYHRSRTCSGVVREPSGSHQSRCSVGGCDAHHRQSA